MPIDRLTADLAASDASQRSQAAEELAQLGPDAQPAAVGQAQAVGDPVRLVLGPSLFNLLLLIGECRVGRRQGAWLYCNPRFVPYNQHSSDD